MPIATPTPPRPQPEDNLPDSASMYFLRRLLRRRLLTLSYHAFAQCLCLLLTKLGYQDVEVAGRKDWKGRNKEGGYDLQAALPAGVGERRVIVQAKQFDRLPLFQRTVDELRGACLRAGAAEALLITTGAISPTVYQHAATTAAIAPVRLLNGEQLLDLLLHHRIGVQAEERPFSQASYPLKIDNLKDDLKIDDAFFAELSRRFPGNRRRARALPPQPIRGITPQSDEMTTEMDDGVAGASPEKRTGSNPSGSNAPGWRVIIRVGPLGGVNVRSTQGKKNKGKESEGKESR